MVLTQRGGHAGTKAARPAPLSQTSPLTGITCTPKHPDAHAPKHTDTQASKHNRKYPHHGLTQG